MKNKVQIKNLALAITALFMVAIGCKKEETAAPTNPPAVNANMNTIKIEITTNPSKPITTYLLNSLYNQSSNLDVAQSPNGSYSKEISLNKDSSLFINSSVDNYTVNGGTFFTWKIYKNGVLDTTIVKGCTYSIVNWKD
ncbi:MAG: hypothetical protein J0M08_05785 [Bacteroidetes bacterium]|nr:hypothetical protein [Bacteroidota bacterium]